jgi:hypothetical protein
MGMFGKSFLGIAGLFLFVLMIMSVPVFAFQFVDRTPSGATFQTWHRCDEPGRWDMDCMDAVYGVSTLKYTVERMDIVAVPNRGRFDTKAAWIFMKIKSVLPGGYYLTTDDEIIRSRDAYYKIMWVQKRDPWPMGWFG